METDIVGITAAVVQNLINTALASALPAVSQLSVTRSFNTAFQPSTAHDCIVSYSCAITTTSTITSGQDGDIFLDIASDSGMSTNLQTIAAMGNSQTFSLAIALQGVQKISGCLAGVVPVGMWARLRTVNNTGTPTYTYRTGQEATL